MKKGVVSFLFALVMGVLSMGAISSAHAIEFAESQYYSRQVNVQNQCQKQPIGFAPSFYGPIAICQLVCASAEWQSETSYQCGYVNNGYAWEESCGEQTWYWFTWSLPFVAASGPC